MAVQLPVGLQKGPGAVLRDPPGTRQVRHCLPECISSHSHATYSLRNIHRKNGATGCIYKHLLSLLVVQRVQGSACILPLDAITKAATCDERERAWAPCLFQ